MVAPHPGRSGARRPPPGAPGPPRAARPGPSRRPPPIHQPRVIRRFLDAYPLGPLVFLSTTTIPQKPSSWTEIRRPSCPGIAQEKWASQPDSPIENGSGPQQPDRARPSPNQTPGAARSGLQEIRHGQTNAPRPRTDVNDPERLGRASETEERKGPRQLRRGPFTRNCLIVVWEGATPASRQLCNRNLTSPWTCSTWIRTLIRSGTTTCSSRALGASMTSSGWAWTELPCRSFTASGEQGLLA